MKGTQLLTEIEGDFVVCHDGRLTANKIARESGEGEKLGSSDCREV